MENTPPFDLNHAINQWREQLGRQPGFRSQNLHELEGHLCDSISVLQGQKLSLEESFIVARHRLGAPGALAAEFSKVNRSALRLERGVWMLVGVQLFVLIKGLAGIASGMALLIGGNRISSTALGVLTSVIYVASFAGATFLVWRLIRNPPLGVRQKLRRLLGNSWLIALAVVFGGVVLAVLASLPMLLFTTWHGTAAMQTMMSAQPWTNLASRVVPLVFVAVSFAWLAKTLATADAVSPPRGIRNDE